MRHGQPLGQLHGIDEEFQKEHNAVCRVSASYLASTWPDAVPREILTAGRRIYLISGFEHEWLQAPQGWLTGRAAGGTDADADRRKNCSSRAGR